MKRCKLQDAPKTTDGFEEKYTKIEVMKQRDEQVRAVQKQKKEISVQEKMVRKLKNCSYSHRLSAEQTRRANLNTKKRYVDH